MGNTAKRSALDFFPDKIDLKSLDRASETCKGCDLYKMATQTVFGEGPATATLMLVGEVPGDEEDKTGHPFVGPAGRLLNEALEEVGIDRKQVYTTNVVKHFKWRESGKRRLHEKPKASEINACKPWLDAELGVVRPRILVFLGATAAQSLLGRDFRVTKMRGQWIASELAEKVLATVHPSSILRAPDSESRQKQYLEFVADLLVVAREMGRSKGKTARAS
jgi:DNA polymerase